MYRYIVIIIGQLSFYTGHFNSLGNSILRNFNSDRQRLVYLHFHIFALTKIQWRHARNVERRNGLDEDGEN
jgi:hypothetical protein